MTITSVLIIAAERRAWRDTAQRRGLLSAGLIVLVVFAPHVYWLRAHDFGPVGYALESSLGTHLAAGTRWLEASHWLADQLFNRLAPALLLLAAIAIDLRRKVPYRSAARAAPEEDARTFLITWGLVPLLFMPLVGLAVGAELQLQWGTPFLLFAVPAVMELAPSRFWSEARLDKSLRCFLWIQALLLAVNFTTSPRGATALRSLHWSTFDSVELSRLVAAPARAELGNPIKVVSGSTAVAGALALQLPEHPVVLIDGRFDRSPWVDAGLVRSCGTLEIGSIQGLPGGTPIGTAFPGLAWRVRARDNGAAPCPASAR